MFQVNLQGRTTEVDGRDDLVGQLTQEQFQGVDAAVDGDYVVVRSQQDAANGEIVAALVGGEEATVKRFERDGATVRLISENPAYQPMVFEDGVQLIGKVVGVLRAVR